MRSESSSTEMLFSSSIHSSVDIAFVAVATGYSSLASSEPSESDPSASDPSGASSVSLSLEVSGAFSSALTSASGSSSAAGSSASGSSAVSWLGLLGLRLLGGGRLRGRRLAHARLAEAFMELDYFDKAKDEILRASELTPNRSVLSKVDNQYLDALTATVRRNFPAAVATYSEIVKADPTKAEAHVDLGRAYEKNSQTDKAIENYSEAIKRDPHIAAAFLRLGILYGRKRDIEASNRAFDKAEESYQSLGNVEGRAEVALQRGVVLNDSVGKPDDARAQLEQARDMAKVVNAPYQQIRILFQLSSVALKQNKGGEAKQFATQALELAQANQMETMIARGYIELGYVDFLTTDYASAEHDFQQGLDYAQKFGARLNEARAQLSLASLYEQRGEADKALTYQEPAQKFYQSAGYRTETNQAMNIRARLYRRKGDFKSALAAFEDQLKFAEQTSDQAADCGGSYEHRQSSFRPREVSRGAATFRTELSNSEIAEQPTQPRLRADEPRRRAVESRSPERGQQRYGTGF